MSLYGYIYEGPATQALPVVARLGDKQPRACPVVSASPYRLCLPRRRDIPDPSLAGTRGPAAWPLAPLCASFRHHRALGSIEVPEI